MDELGAARSRGATPVILRVLLGVGFLIAAAATVLAVFVDTVPLLRLAVVLAVWAALIAAFAVAWSRRDAKAAAMRVGEAHLAYQVELQREVSARHEYEADLAAQMAAEQSQQIAELREQLDRLTDVLSSLADGELMVSRMTLSAQSARFRKNQAVLGESAAFEIDSSWPHELLGERPAVGPQPAAEPVPVAEPVREPESDVEPELAYEPDLEPAAEPEREPIAEPEPDLESAVEPERDVEPESAVEPEPIAEPEPEWATGPTVDSASDWEPASAPWWRSVAAADREPAYEPEPGPVPAAAYEPEPEPEPDSAPRRSRHAAPDSDAELADSDAEAVADAAEPPLASWWSGPAAQQPSWVSAAIPDSPTEPTPPPALPEPTSHQTFHDAPQPPLPEAAPQGEAPEASVDDLLAAYGLTSTPRRRRRD